jgi:hypothetical protein
VLRFQLNLVPIHCTWPVAISKLNSATYPASFDIPSVKSTKSSCPYIHKVAVETNITLALKIEHNKAISFVLNS